MTDGFQGGTPGNGHDGDRPLERLIHPGSGRRKAPKTRKGRQVEPETRAEIHALLGDRPRNRDLLIEFLHLLQDRYGHLSARHLAALAEETAAAVAAVVGNPAYAARAGEIGAELNSLPSLESALGEYVPE